MSLTSWLWGSTQVDEAIDKATSELLPAGAEDIALNLEICDQIRSKAVPPKDAMRALKRRMNHKNPNVQLLALSLIDICIKNGGDHFLVEVASREHMDNLVSILKMPTLNFEVKNKLLRLIQNWAVAFEGKPTLGYVGQVYKTLKNEGFTFPPQDLAAASAAMVDTQTAPEWIDSDVCLRCRTPFSFTNRKHHCRNCGQVFDQQCSAKLLPLPHFGIAQEVRVCDGCYVKLTKNKKEKSHSVDSKHQHSSSRHRSARELADAELQRAIQLSLSEVGAPNGSGHRRPGYVPSQPSPSAYTWQSSEPPLVDRSTRPQAGDEDDPELMAAIEASLREANAPKPSAPIPVETPRSEEPGFQYGQQQYSQSYPPTVVQPALPTLPNYDLQPVETDAILTFSQTVEQVEAQGGRDMARYPAVTELYDKASGLRPKLAMALDDTDRKEKMLSDMHDKLSQVVKLYDKALTEQVSRPAWRAPAAASTSQQQRQYAPSRYNTVDSSYGQWTPNQSMSPVLQGQPQQPLAHGTVPQPQYAQQYPQYVSSPPAEPLYQQHQHHQQQWTQQPYREPPNQEYSQPPPQQYSPPTPAPAPSLSQPLSQYNHQPQPQASFQQHPPPTPVSLPQSPPAQPSQYAAPPPPPQQVQSPVPDAHSYQYAQSPGSHAMLSRQNTATYTSPQTTAAAFTGAQAPVAPIPSQSQYQPQVQVQSPAPIAYQHQQQSQLQQPVQAPAPIPHFPTAPTSNPQVYPMYGPGPPVSGVEQTERKEALLIDL